VVLLGYNLWQSMFHGDRNVLGRIVKLDEQPFAVIGVLPREAVLPTRMPGGRWQWTRIKAAPTT